jgi:parallel beta-helix repeat protein
MNKTLVFSTKSIFILMMLILLGNQPNTAGLDQVFAYGLNDPESLGNTIVVTSTADSGPGTLRQALLDAQNGDTITFDSVVFPPAAPVTISVTSELPNIHQGNLTIESSNAGVILNGGNIGTTPETLLLDDISLSLDGGPNLILNSDFSAGLGHWRPWDEASGSPRNVNSIDFNTSPTSYAWSITAHAGEAHTVYDTTNTSDPFNNWPHHIIYYPESTVWIPVTGEGTVELRFWYKYGSVGAQLHGLFSDGHAEDIGEWWFDQQADWTEALVHQIVPVNTRGLALELKYHHSDYWTRGLSISSSGNIIQGLQIVGFPAAGIELSNDAHNNRIGGDPTIGLGPLGQGNLLSSNGNRGIILSEATYNTIVGNYIGTNLSGTQAWGNRWEAIHMNGGSHNLVDGNLLSGNFAHGIDLCCNASYNTIRDNLIGTDAQGGNPLGNHGSGIAMHQGSSYNIVGPNNVIAYNDGSGVNIGTGTTLYNTITQNHIYDNQGMGIDLYDGGNRELTAPFITLLDLNAGNVIGNACANCVVEFFSDSGDEGEIFEGWTRADSFGVFFFDKDEAFAGPSLTATTTDVDGNTSEFSTPISDSGDATLQKGNNSRINPLHIKEPNQLEGSRIGGDVGNWEWVRGEDNTELYDDLARNIRDAGLKWVRTGFWSPNPLTWQEILRAPGVYEIPKDVDDFVTELADSKVNILLTLSTGAGLEGQEDDEECWGGPGWGVLGDTEPAWWFDTQDDRDKFIDYARFMVQHFKDRVRYFEIWNEPIGLHPGGCPGSVSANDYAILVTQVIPVIRQVDPQAKIVAGAMPKFFEDVRQALLMVLESGIASQVDALSWHPFYGESPAPPNECTHLDPLYWREYPAIVRNFQQQAAALGFQGEYMVEEMVWRTPTDDVTHECPLYTDIVAAKYAARSNVLHLGLEFAMISNQMLMPDVIKTLPRYYIIRNLSTAAAGAEPTSLPLTIQSTMMNTVSYTFSLPNENYLIALWNDGMAVDVDPGVPATLIIAGFAGYEVTGIDVLHGFQQQLLTSQEDGDLVIRDLLVKDYPIILRLYEPKYIFLPSILGGVVNQEPSK